MRASVIDGSAPQWRPLMIDDDSFLAKIAEKARKKRRA